MRRLTVLLCLWLPLWAMAAPSSSSDDGDTELSSHIDQLEEPLYSPFIERYLLDEVRSSHVGLVVFDGDGISVARTYQKKFFFCSGDRCIE